MKQIHFLLPFSLFFACAFATTITAQTASTDKSKRWVVNSPLYAESSAESVVLDKLERNDKYTIVYMSYVNASMGYGGIEACNTFHIQTNGKTVAKFVKAENIPTRDLRNVPFTCAKEPYSLKVKPFQTVRFKLYFTPIPADALLVDIVEFDGEQSCEFDIWGVKLNKKIALPPLKTTAKPPTVAAKEAPKKSEPSVAAAPKAKKKPKTEPKPTKPSEPLRELVVKETVKVQNDQITVEIWDNDKEDGDIVSLMFNNAWVLRHYEVKKAKKILTLQLQKGENTLTSYAENLGLAPPNTAAVRIIDGEVSQTIIVKSDMTKSETIKIIR